MKTTTQGSTGTYGRLRRFPRLLAATFVAAATIHAAGATAGATVIPASAFCPDPASAIVGTTARDHLKTGRDAGCILADAGDDKIKGGGSNDVLDPGPGIDTTNAGGGDDIIIIRGACEVGRGEVVKGGRGNDTVESPLTRSQLEALGVKFKAIETFEVLPPNRDGGCALGADGYVCTCCNKDGFDPAAECSDCAAGYLLDRPGDGDGDMIGARVEEASCNAVPSCADLDCGLHGTCDESPTHGPSCACDDGFAGSACEDCAPHYQATLDGRCVLGRDCAKALCGGHGDCVADADGRLSCQCDPGFDATADCGGPDAVVGGPGSVVAGQGPYTFSVRPHNGSHCTTGWVWTATEGSIHPDATDSTHAVYTPPSAVSGHTDGVRIQAECGNNGELGGRFDVSVTAPGVGAPSRDGGIVGPCDEELSSFDDAVLEWLQQQNIQGATLAVTYRENVVCLRGYGKRTYNVASNSSAPMNACTPMRVASVSKPFTRAALRGNLFGMSIPAPLGGGVLGDNTLVLPMLAATMGLGPNGEVGWQAPAAIYGANNPVNLGLGIPCSVTDGLINSNWFNININNMLGHTAGFAPNDKYAFSPGTGVCTGDVDGEVCGSSDAVGDPTITATTRMANDLGLAYGQPNINDIVKWMAGVCPFDVASLKPGVGNYRYSNVGLTVAGKIIENLSGKTYEKFVTDFLTADNAIGLDLPGSPIVYQGQSLGGGPKGYSLPDYMEEANYYTARGNMTDVTTPVFSDGQWKFPNTVPAPYGGASFDAMAPHGGLVMNALGLANFGSEYLVKDGTPRALSRGGKGRTYYYDTDRKITHAGLLFGTSALIWEMPTLEPALSNNPNGPGCLIPADVEDDPDPSDDEDTSDDNALNVLDAEHCPLPPGIRVSIIFNGEQRDENSDDFVRGRHDWGLLAHMLRKAAADVGTTATEWDALDTFQGEELRIGCDVQCLDGGLCIPITCGNGVVDKGEECDDGDNEDGDACSADCSDEVTGPAGYEDCEGEDPGNCLGGPCAPRQMQAPISDTDLLDPFSAVHPDGDWSPDTFCHDSHTQLSPPWDEATCVRTKVLGKDYGVCKECGVDTMIGCSCPAPNLEDGGCNIDGVSDGLDCVGGRCWKDLPPPWMCTADCDNDIYGTGGYCFHEDKKGATCYNAFCSEPVDNYCSEEFGQVCDVNVDGCENGSCCTPECLDEEDCDELGYSPGHLCVQERCVLN